MGKGLRAVWLGITDAYGELFPVVGMNLVWLLLSTPIAAIGLVFIVIGVGTASIAEDARQAVTGVLVVLMLVLLTIGPNPAAAGIHLWANRLAKEERVEFSLFWEGLRTYWWKALRLFLISMVGFVLLSVNALFYLRSETQILQLFGIVWLYAIYFWTSMQIYQLPLLIEQEDKRLRLVLRNSFFLALSNFGTTIVVVVICTVLTVISLGLTLLIALVTGAVVALICTRALHLLLERYRAPAVGDGSAASTS
ncbi:MAG TPA: hypothetical protein VGM69_09255 [Chloroflexota bacterium]|jgi:uncharacterized membrane protein YesL